MQDKPIVNAAKAIVSTAIVIFLLSTTGCDSNGKTNTSNPNPYAAYAEAACGGRYTMHPSPECLREREAQCSYTHAPHPAVQRLACIIVRIATQPVEPDIKELEEAARAESEVIVER